MDFTHLWNSALTLIQISQAERGWLRHTTAVIRDRGAIEVRVGDEQARAWLENHRVEIEQSIIQVAGSLQAGVRFVVAASSPARREEPASRGFVVPEFDVHAAGWFPVSEYECRFWAPFLGRVTWRVWEIVRRADKRAKKTAWTPRRRWTAPALAEMVPCGRQAVLGVERRCEAGDPGAIRGVDDDTWYRRFPGAFDRLQDSGLAVITRQGERRHTSYWISVRVQMGLLSGEQMRTLPGRLQVQHDHWLEEHGLDPLKWNGKSL